MRRSVQAAPWPFLLLLLVFLLACPKGSTIPAGDVDYQRLAHLPVPGGVVNGAGGNLLLRRVDLSIDTRLGTRRVGARYNSVDGLWRWSFEPTFDGATFVDGSGARLGVGGVAPGQAIPGTEWVVVDGTTLQTKGGLVHAFRPDGQLARIHWSSGAYPSLELAYAHSAGADRAVRIDQCTGPGVCSLVFDLQRDAAGRVVAIQDRAGRSADFAYDASGRLVAARDGLDTARGWSGRLYGYDVAGRLASITNSEGERVEVDLDAAGRLLELRQIGGGDPTWRLSHQTSSRRTELTDPTGAVTRVAYDSRRRVVSRTNGAGEETLFEWTGLRPTRRTAPDGTTTEWTWQNDDMATARSPSGNVVTFTWAPHGVNRADPHRRALARSEDGLGLIEERIYDAAGRLVEKRNGAGEATTWEYGADEMVARRTTPDGVVLDFAGHGDHGHPTIVTNPHATVHPRYDAVGNRLEGPGTGEAGGSVGGIVERAFDEDRNLSQVVLADGSQAGAVLRSLVLQYRSDHQRTAVLRPYGADTVWVHDAHGRAIERRDKSQGAWASTSIERDLRGRVVARERPNGMREEWFHDAAGRTIRHAILRGGLLESEAFFAYAAGRLVSVSDSAHGAVPETLSYDAYGRPAQVNHPGGEQTWLVYDARSRVVLRGFGDTATGFLRTVAVSYDAAGRDRTLWDGASMVRDRQYANGLVTQESYGNGLVRSFSYGPGGERIGAVTVNGQGQTIETTAVTESCAFFIPLCWHAHTQTYGAVSGDTQESYQLLAATDGGPGSEGGARIERGFTWGGGAESFFFDAQSNRTGGVGAAPVCGGIDTWSFTYDAERSRLLQATTVTCGTGHAYAYDSAGFVVDRDGVSLEWDGAGRIRAIGADTFAWDTRGRPLSRTLGGVTTTWRFGGAIEADAAGLPAALDLGEVRIALGSGARLYRHMDFRQNVRFVTDDAGAVVAHYRYAAYGVQSVIGDASADPVRRFAQGHDLGGLVLLGHRVLDPDVGRFLAPDPVFQLINQYTYTIGNPIDFWDPSGRFQVKVSTGLAVVAIAVGLAGTFATAPVWAVGLGLASAGLSIASLVVAEFEGVPNPEPGSTPQCGCGPPGPPRGPPGGSPGSGGGDEAGADGEGSGGSGGTMIKTLTIEVAPGGSLGFDWSFALGVALQLGGLNL